MKDYTNIIILAVVVIVIIAIVNMKKPAEEAPAETDTIKVGVLLPLTGDAAVYGEPAKNIYQLAVDEINQSGGIGGKNMELIVEDSKCVGTAAVNAAQKLINIDKVQVIVGGFCSSESLSVAPVATAAKVALLSPGSSSPELTGISPYFFRNYPSDASQGKVLAGIAYNDKGWKNVAFAQEQTDYAEGVYKAFADEFKSLGGTVTNESFATQTTDFRSILTKIKTSKADALFIDTQTPAVAARMMQQITQLQWKPNLLLNDAITGDVSTVAQNAGLIEGALTAEFGVDLQNEKFSKLAASYKSKYGTELPYQSYAQTEYDALYLLKDALLANGNDGQKIADWSRTVSGWSGASGSVTILPNGDRDGGHVPRLIQSGKVVPYSK